MTPTRTQTRKPTPRTSSPRPAAAEEPTPDLASVAKGEYRELLLTQLVVNPRNARKKLRYIDEMTASVKEVGVIEPLIVRPHGPEVFQIAFGHRRFAAATQAGLSSVPCLIRDLDEAQLVQEALMENIHRDDLTYIEEAEQLSLLMDLRSLTVKDLAQSVGRSATHVTARLSLLTLPEPAREALDREVISLGIALALAEISDYPELIEELIDQENGVDPAELDSARRHVAVERECARLREEAAAKGLRLVEDDPRKLGFVYLAELDHLTTQQQSAHARQSCHVVYLEVSFGRPRLTALCSNPDKHAPASTRAEGAEGNQADPALPDADGADGADAASQTHQEDANLNGQAQRNTDAQARRDERERRDAEEMRNRKRVATARREFLSSLVAKRTPRRGEAVVFTFGAVMERASSNTLAWVGKTLGLTPETTQYGTTDWRTPLVAYAARGGDELLKAALLVSFSWAEERISPYTQGYEPFAARYVEVLASLGYTPDPYEAEQIAYARQAAEEAATVQDAERVDQQDDDEQEAAEPGDVEVQDDDGTGTLTQVEAIDISEETATEEVREEVGAP